jgi:hypothetical protein
LFSLFRKGNADGKEQGGRLDFVVLKRIVDSQCIALLSLRSQRNSTPKHTSEHVTHTDTHTRTDRQALAVV